MKEGGFATRLDDIDEEDEGTKSEKDIDDEEALLVSTHVHKGWRSKHGHNHNHNYNRLLGYIPSHSSCFYQTFWEGEEENVAYLDIVLDTCICFQVYKDNFLFLLLFRVHTIKLWLRAINILLEDAILFFICIYIYLDQLSWFVYSFTDSLDASPY